ncbi:MAG: type II toxin-antitoxin system RelE/ParE family toxin [Clostridiales bacterium]
MYKITYLLIAKKDLMEIIEYITNKLNVPKIALDLLESFEESILRLEQFPFSCKVYKSKMKDFESEYRLLPVKNYVVFYVVKEKFIEIHRILYSKMDLNKLFK